METKNKLDKALETIRNKQRAEVAQQTEVEAVASVVTDINMDTNDQARAEVAAQRVKAKRITQGTKSNRATFIVDPLLVARLKVVAAFEGRTYTKTVERALVSYLKTWQIAHPFVDLDKIMYNYKDEQGNENH